jgi:3-oxoisoapionate kinase
MTSLATPNPLLLAYYGDDFTGSTDALESLAQAGLRTVLFLQPPTPEQLALFPGLRAFGISGGSRTMSPAEMESELPPAFEALRRSGAPIIHYKTCSTFDSSPVTGSVGKAIEMGRRVFGEHLTPLVVGLPEFGRHVLFGNLFARSGDSEPLRLDRHPMSRHPVTPMDEADLRVHLARQTPIPVELVDVLKLRGWRHGGLKGRDGGRDRRDRGTARRYESVQRVLDKARTAAPPPIVLFDTLDDDDLPLIGRLISSQVQLDGQLFCAGSSGVGYALVAYWRQAGLLPMLQDQGHRPAPLSIGREPRQTLIVSGSCSPNTDRQIGCALEAGFVEVACDSAKLVDRDRAQNAVRDAIALAMPPLRAGRHVIFHTARGTTDPRRAAVESAIENSSGAGTAGQLAAARARLGHNLGLILLGALEASGARRAVICGGDTATQAGRALGIVALEFLAPVVTGAPLCRVHAQGNSIDGCELVCKGGQMGPDSFLLDLVSGAPAANERFSQSSQGEPTRRHELPTGLSSYDTDQLLAE